MEKATKTTRTQFKRVAQEELMRGIANILGYWRENPPEIMNGYDVTDAQRQEYETVLQREADRVARLFGYDGAWSN